MTSMSDIQSMRDTWKNVDVAMKQFIDHLITVKTNIAETVAPSKQTSTSATTADNERVMVNVGGTVFVTTEGTLTGANSSTHMNKDTFFRAMLQNKDVFKPDDDTGEYFIDRCPHVFPYILDYLRAGTGVLNLCNIPAHQRNQLQQELDFFQIQPYRVIQPEQRKRKTLTWLPNQEAAKKGIYVHDEKNQRWSKEGSQATNHATPFFGTCLDAVSVMEPITWKVTVTSEVATKENGWWAGLNAGIDMDNKTWITCGINGNVFDCTPKSSESKIFGRWGDTEATRSIVMTYYPCRQSITFQIDSELGMFVQTYEVTKRVAALPYPVVLVNDRNKIKASVTIQLLSTHYDGMDLS